MLTLQILHASDLEGGVDDIADAANFATVVQALEDDAAGRGRESILLSAGDNFKLGPFFSASGHVSIADTYEGFYNEFFGLIDVNVLSDNLDTDGDGFFDNDEIEAAINAGVVTFEQVYVIDVNGDGLADYFEELDAANGRIDIAIMNALGFDASAIGNHEFDADIEIFNDAVIYDSEEGNELSRGRYDDNLNYLQEVDALGAQFPYLSANLDFSADMDEIGALFIDEILINGGFFSDLDSARVPLPGSEQLFPALFQTDGGAPDGRDPKLAPAALIPIDANRDVFGVVAATTQLIESISSTGPIAETSGGVVDVAALAAALQPSIDALIQAGANKVMLTSHLQDFALEQQLAPLLRGVDVIIAGGSDTIAADGQDILRPGDVADQPYPFLTTNADNEPVAIVTTAGGYDYVGRLVVTFDENGVLLPESVDPGVSGAFATDEAGVLSVTGAETLEEAIAASSKGETVEDLVGALTQVVAAFDSSVAGVTEVFIDGRRSQVRTEETTVGNVTADALLAAAQTVDPNTTVVLRSGSTIRTSIGEIEDDGTLLPPQANPVAGRAQGQISGLAIDDVLRSNNETVLLTVDTAGLKVLLEHAVAGSQEGTFPGQFFQLAGISVEVDLSGSAQQLDGSGNVTVPGGRIVSARLDGVDGGPDQIIIANGEVLEGAPEAIRVATLDVLLGDPGNLRGGDGYPFQAVGRDFVFETGILEQQATFDYLADTFATVLTPFTEDETGPGQDGRIQFVDERIPTVTTAPVGTDELSIGLFRQFQGNSDPFDEDRPEGASEVVAIDGSKLYVTNGSLDRVDIFDLTDGKLTPVNLAGLPNYDGVQSVAAGGGIFVAVVDVEPSGGVPNPGLAAIFDQETLELITTVQTGNLPDSVSISPDGSVIAIANEGEFNSESDLTQNAAGTITLIDISNVNAPVTTEIGFDGTFADQLRLFPGIDPALDVEPEFTNFSPDGSTLYVSLQENNAIAVVDVATGTLTNVFSAGVTDHSLEGNELDVTDDDFGDVIIDIETRPVLGLRMPDAITSVEIGGALYILGANEGDGRGDAFDDGAPVPFGDEARVSELVELGLIDESVDTTNLDRLIVSTIDGDTDGDGDIDQITAFGSRSFTIYDADGTVVFDSGSDFERIIAQAAPFRFNDDDGEQFQNRSDAKGPEPEAIATGVIGDKTFAFIGLERDSGIMIYDISDPANASFVDYIDGFAGANIGPETIGFIPASESVSGNAQIAVAYEISGTTAVYDLATDGSPVVNAPEDVYDVGAFYQGALGRTADLFGGNFWLDQLLPQFELADGFLTSIEFTEANPGIDAAGLTAKLYENVLGVTSPDAEGAAFWTSVGENEGLASLLVNFTRGAPSFQLADPNDVEQIAPGVWEFA